MLLNTVIRTDTISSMTYNINTSTLCLLPVRVFYMINNTLSIIATINAHNDNITSSTTIIIEISMVIAIIPSIIGNTGINRCRTVTAITTTVLSLFR